MNKSFVQIHNKRLKKAYTNRWDQYALMDQYRPDPGPDPDPPDPPTPDPPVPGQFNPWLTSPGEGVLSSGYFIDIDFGGSNRIPYRRYWGMYPNQYYANLPYYSVLPNCTGYAWGRLLYMTNGVQPSISAGDAYSWIDNTSWPTSQTPSLGAVACWRGGLYGHVAIVEYIHYSGGVWDYMQVSESGYYNRYYGGSWWNFGGCQLTTVYASNPGRSWSGYSLVGFINTPSNLIVQ